MSKIQVRRGTTTEWTAANPVLASGELGLDTTTGVLKTGNGSTAWNSLTVTYAPGSVVTTVTPTAWTVPAFTAGWGQYAGYSTVSYRKIGDLVYLRGLLNATTGVTTTAWTFPVGFRPPATVLTYTAYNGALRRIDIQPSGAFTISAPAVGEWYALDMTPPFSTTA
jgi:Major tropism determinant N-terminal domain